MQVVRHDDEGIQLDEGVVVGDLLPGPVYNFAVGVVPHRLAHDLTEGWRLRLGANGDGVGPGSGVVELC